MTKCKMKCCTVNSSYRDFEKLSQIVNAFEVEKKEKKNQINLIYYEK